MSLTQINKAGLDEIALDHVFTIGASGSSAYTFQGEGSNGTVNNPTLYLTRGKTYRFENGSGGHPIRIQSTSGASGTAYNTGVTNNAGSGTVIVEVQHDAPDILYYQCTSHAAMNGILYITGALADGGVTTAKIANNAVTNAKVASNAISSATIIDANVTTAKIANDAVTTTKIADSQVTTAKINNAAVTTAKIADDAVTNAKMANNAVDDAVIAALAVTTPKIADNAVTNAKIASGVVNTSELTDNAVTHAKYQDIPTSRLLGRTSSGTGDVETLDDSTVRSFLGVSAGANQTTINQNASNRVITGSSTANNLNGQSKFTFDGSLVTTEKRMVIGNGTDFQIPSRSNTSSYTPQLQVTGAWNDPTHGGTLALNGRTDYPFLWLNSGASYTDGSGAGVIAFSIKDGAGNYCNTASIRSQVDGTPANNDSPGDLRFLTTPDGTCNPVVAMTITQEGAIKKQKNPIASVYTTNHNQGASNSKVSDDYLANNGERFDIGNNHNNSNGRYTCPVDGVYRVSFSTNIEMSSAGTVFQVEVRKNGSQVHINYDTRHTTNWQHMSFSNLVNCNKNDYLQIRLKTNSGSIGVDASVLWNRTDYELVG